MRFWCRSANSTSASVKLWVDMNVSSFFRKAFLNSALNGQCSNIFSDELWAITRPLFTSLGVAQQHQHTDIRGVSVVRSSVNVASSGGSSFCSNHCEWLAHWCKGVGIVVMVIGLSRCSEKGVMFRAREELLSPRVLVREGNRRTRS